MHGEGSGGHNEDTMAAAEVGAGLVRLDLASLELEAPAAEVKTQGGNGRDTEHTHAWDGETAVSVAKENR